MILSLLYIYIYIYIRICRHQFPMNWEFFYLRQLLIYWSKSCIMWCSRIRSDPLHCLSIRARWILMHTPDWCRLIPLVQIVADLMLNLWGMLWFEFNFRFLWDLTAVFSMSWCFHIWCNMGTLFIAPEETLLVRRFSWTKLWWKFPLLSGDARHTLGGATVC